MQRNQPDGVIDVTRQTLHDDGCSCIIHTGNAEQGGEAEALVGNIARSRSCPARYVMQMPAPDFPSQWLDKGRLDLAGVLPAAEIANPAGEEIILLEQDIPAGP
ncbi:MAG: hypothetical protein WA957_04270 [Alteraurantiacibacter sp.]